MRSTCVGPTEPAVARSAPAAEAWVTCGLAGCRFGRRRWAQGIRVNCVAPGPVYTPMVIRNGMSDKAREDRRIASPLKVEGEGWDIGNAVTFLMSDRARYITGQTLVVDGGCTIVGPARESDQ